MRVHEKRMCEVDVLVDTVCDLCGKSSLNPIDANFEFATLQVSWGYGSRKDCEYHELHICEDCYDKLPFLDKVRVYDYTCGMVPVSAAAKKGGPLRRV